MKARRRRTHTKLQKLLRQPHRLFEAQSIDIPTNRKERRAIAALKRKDKGQ
jgi:hypothetical protein